MKNISRRDFLKGAAAGAAGFAACSLFGATAFADDGPEKEAGGLFVPEKVDEVFDCDVVIVGGGISGLAAAVQAGESGLKAIVLEKGAAPGGAGIGVEGIFACGTEDQKAQGIEMDSSTVIRHELKTSQYFANGVLWTDLVNASAENYEWLKENGVQFSGVIDNYGNGIVPSFHWFEGGVAAVGYVPPMTEKAESLGVEFITEASGRSLIFDGTTVSGVYAERKDGGFIQVNAKAVILSTGGFSYNDKLLEQWGWNMDYLTKIGLPNSDGSGIEMGLSVGGQDCVADACSLVAGGVNGIPNMGADATGQKLGYGGPFLWVNGDGERFCPEDISSENTMASYLPAIVQRVCYSVADSQIIKGLLTEDEMKTFASTVEKCPDDNIYEADTLEELAEKFGLDPAALTASVERYNEMCNKGMDTDFAKDPSMLLPIRETPFYMFRLDPAVLVMIGGLGTSRDFEVLKGDGTTIPGLYAIGVDGVRLYRHSYPIDVPGSCCANNVNSGRRAIRHIAANL